ncbi:NADPH2:quinone reductase [Zopfia rhizophila CBS 207.26]|uniref:NADPH2:quinone reductase n=1 Tax=Zopfia rhizophila CBS 207.26 TaxID=1314779 RepID=A0A6A6EDG9_9PEZI|nr:NADPH2:quinone reductase [Zopfia rhizophila CBS 207.26]
MSTESSPGSAKMKAINIRNDTGPAEALFLNESPIPIPKDSQVLVKVKAFGLNRMDLSQRLGNYPVPPQAGNILGVEFSGVVEHVGRGVTGKFKVGEEVFGLTYGGAYAECVAVEAGTLMHKPNGLSWEEAASIPEAWMTATQALRIANFCAGKTIMWHAGASSVSIAGIQLSLAGGATAVYATAGSQDKLDFCVKTLGATDAFNYKEKDFSVEIDRLTNGKGVDIIIDFVGQSYLQKNLNRMAKDGSIIALAAMSGSVAKEIDLSAFVRKRVRLQGSTLRSRDERYQERLCDHFVEVALPSLSNGSFKLCIERVFSWEKIVEAHKLMESNQTKGKIICTI